MTYIDDSNKWRLSMTGFSIKTGWSDEKLIIAAYPGESNPVDTKQYQEWIENAEHICDLHNEWLMKNKESS